MTKKQKSQTMWIVFNAAMMFTCIRGVGLGIEVDQNIFRFLVWITCPFIIAGTLNDKVSAMMKKARPAVPAGLVLMTDMLMACICAGRAWFGYAALVGVAALLSHATYTSDDPETKEKTQDDESREQTENADY